MTKIQITAIISLVIGAILLFIGALAKIEHFPYGNFFLMFGMLVFTIACILAIYNVFYQPTKSKTPTEK